MLIKPRTKQKADINYVSKDFDSIKQDLIEYLKENFANEINDFNESSGGMAILELIAYVGDFLSFYIDRQANETFINRAIEEKNIIGLSKTLGRKPKFSTPSLSNISVSAILHNSTSANELFTIKKGTKVITNFEPSVTFEIIDDIDFSSAQNRTLQSDSIYTTASVSGVSVVAGNTRTFVYTVGAPKQFLRINLPDEDITEIVSVTGSDGSVWNEVDYLAQEYKFIGEENLDISTTASVPFVLKLKKMPKRFIVDRHENGMTSLVFGSGKTDLDDSELIPNPDDFVLPNLFRGSPSGFLPAISDSSQFLNTNTLGIAPKNISLDITYRYGGGIETNVGPNTIQNIRDLNIRYKNTDLPTVSADITDFIERNISVNNEFNADGGSERETLEEMREYASAFFSTQNRLVSIQDYQIFSLSMPQKYGTVFRSFARKDVNNNLGVEILLMSRDNNGHLKLPEKILKNNLATYIKKYKSFSDSVIINSGKIVNISVEFTIVPRPDVNNIEAIIESIFELRNIFDTRNTNFADILVIPEIISSLQSLEKVRAVSELKIKNLVGTQDGRVYSDTVFHVDENTYNGIIYLPQDCVWELKFPESDIIGKIAQ